MGDYEDPFEIKPVETTDETIPLLPRGNTIDTHQTDQSEIHETSFGGTGNSLGFDTIKIVVDGLYEKIIPITGEDPGKREYDLFERRDGELYIKGKKEPLTKKGYLLSSGEIKNILGKTYLRKMGFDIPKDSKVSARQAMELNKLNQDLPSTSDIDNASNIELINIADQVHRSIENLEHVSQSTQTDNLFELPMRELLSLDKEARTRTGHIKTLNSKMVSINQEIEEIQNKIDVLENSTEYNEAEKRPLIEQLKNKIINYEEIREGYEKNISDLKYELGSQISKIKETISKVLDSDTTLGEKIRTLFREQGITIFSVLTAFGMVIGFMVEALIPSGGGSASTTPSESSGGGETAKDWIKNKLKALASLLGKLASKAAAALPGIIGSIISWILTRAKEVVGWLSQNLWALIVGIGGLIYTYLITRK